MLARLFAILLAFFLGLMSSGCATLDYLAQAGAGQDDLVSRSRDIDMLLQERRLEPRTRRLVAEIGDVKRYGEAHGLRPTKNYTKYARLDRPAAVWIVSACEPLRFRSKVWSFPVVGTFTYLGWFHLDQANEAGERLRKEGWDADVRPAGAYSTGGFFDDPLLSTMIGKGDDARGHLVNTVFHESMHATFFVPGQSRLNESVANFIGDTLADEYLARTAGEDAKETRAYRASVKRGARREALMHAAYQELETLYASARPREEKLAEKARVLRKLEAELGITRRLTNASLVQFKTYHSGEKELEALFEACGRDSTKLVRALVGLQRRAFPVDQDDPAHILAPLVAEGCKG